MEQVQDEFSEVYLSEGEELRITERRLKLLKEKRASAATVIDEIGIEKFRNVLAPATKFVGKPNEQNSG